MAGFTDKPLCGKKEDIFNVDKYIKGLSDYILECDTPMTVAVQGDWGSGKTSFMMLTREELGDRVLPVWFNTWQFSQFNMGERLPLILVSKLTSALELKGYQSDAMKSSLRAIGGMLLHMGLSAANSLTGIDVAGAVASQTEVKDEDVIKAISTLKENFQECVEQALRQKNKERVVFFVDDLDRLCPERAVELLEVLKLFLDCDKCVFLLAVDYAVVSQGVQLKYGESIGLDKGKSFFDKIIQVPFKMPVAHYDIANFVSESMKLPTEYVETYVSLIQTSIGFNPRGIKRLMNAFLLLQRIHSGEHLEQEHEKRLLFAVLCLQLSYEEVYNFVVRNSKRLHTDFFVQLAQQAQYEITDENEDELSQNDLLKELLEYWPGEDNPDIKRITDFMSSFKTALCTTGDSLSDDDLKILVKLLNFSVTTTTESENISSRRVSKNGISGKGNRNVYKLDEVASYHAIDESIPYDAKEYPGWNASKLEGFCLFGREEKVIKYSQLMVRVLDILYLKNPEKFREIVRNPEEHELASLFCNIKKPQKLPSVDIEVESYSSSQVKVTQLCKMMKAMKFEPGELKLKVRLAN